MHRTNEANLSSITDNLEKLRESFGQWVNLSIESDCKVVVTSAAKSIFKRGTHEIKLGNFREQFKRGYSKDILGKKIKARLCDVRPSFLGGYKGNRDSVSIWEN